MNRKLTAIGVTAVLSATAFAGLTTAAPKQQAQPAAKSYLVAFQGDLPTDYAAQIANAGGKVVRTLDALGGVEVESTNPSFLDNLQSVSGIQAANVELKHHLDDIGASDPAAADGSVVTDIPQAKDVDSYWSYQWDIQKITNNGASYGIETGGTKQANGTVKHKAVVGVIDTGIDKDHPDLKANFLGGRNFVPAGVDSSEKGDATDLRDREGHGTHVTGSIAANGKVKGVGPDLGFRSYRIFPESGSAPTAWIVDAIVAAANDGVDVINMSIGGFDNSKYFYQGQRYNDVADVLLWRRAVQYAVQHNVTVVSAAGNESLNLNDKKSVTDYMNAAYGSADLVFTGVATETPGQIPGVINVSSSNQWSKDSIAFYSNYGSPIDVAAPGGDNGPVYDSLFRQDPAGDFLNKRDFHYRALSTWPTYLAPYFTANLRSYALLHGTSMASPKVAGIAGVIKAAHPEYTPSQVEAAIKQTANDLGKQGQDPLFGSGEANIDNALRNITK